MRERIEQRRSERRAFMERLYVVTEGSVSEFVDAYGLGSALSIERAEVRRYLEYFAEKGWIVVDDFRNGIIRITAEGVDRSEALLTE